MNSSLLPVARPLLTLRRAAAGPSVAGPAAGRPRRRLGVSRRGSILIFVVALLVLLAVIGSAYIGTQRTDRYATQQNANNTEVDLLVDGVQNAVEAELLSGVRGDGLYRPVGLGDYRDETGLDFSPLNDAAATPPVDVPAGAALLASRVPTLYNPLPGNFLSNANEPTWPVVSGPVLAGRFESPIQLNGAGSDLTYSNRLFLRPGSFTAAGGTLLPTLRTPGNGSLSYVAGDADGDGIADGGLVKIPVGRIAGLTYYAVVRVVDNGSAVNVNTAGSRSMDFAGNGTGTPTTGFYGSNLGLIEMLQTYNAAAVFPAVKSGNYATINHDGVGNELFNLDATRMNQVNARAAGVLGAPATVGTNPIHDDSTLNPDATFNFLTLGDALQMQLGRRLENPGYNTAAALYQPFADADWMALIYPFGLTGGGAGATSPLATAIYQSLDTPASNLVVAGTATNPTSPQRGPFAADDANRWFDTSFNFNQENHGNAGNAPLPLTYRPVRTLLTGNSGESNLTPVHYAFPANQPPTPSVPNQIRQAITTAVPVVDAMFFQTPGQTPRLSANVADKSKLWWAYWNAMTEFNATSVQPDAPFWQVRQVYEANAGATALNDPYLGGRFVDPGAGATTGPDGFAAALPTAAQTPKPLAPQTAEYHPDRMFRSPLRAVNKTPGTPITSGAPRILPRGMVLVRSAIAAANAVDWRDTDYDVTTMRVDLTVNDQEVTADVPAMSVAIFGQEPQPFITEIYVQTDTVADPFTKGPNVGGYVAVELHNPYPFAIDLLNCKLGLLNRTQTSTYPDMPLVDSSTAAMPINLAAATSNLADPTQISPTVIPPGGYLVLENYNAAGGAVSTDAHYRPGSLNLPVTYTAAGDGQGPVTVATVGAPLRNFAFVSNLQTVLDHEVVLMRPLTYLKPTPVAAMKLPQAVIAGQQVDVLQYTQPPTPNLFIDFAPLDSYDFTSIAITTTAAWHYVRASDRATNPWRFVYPGRYDGDQALGAPRQQGTQRTAAFAAGTDPDPWDTTATPVAGIQPNPAVNVGAADTAASFPISFTVQLNNAGRYPFGTTNSAGTLPPFFPFGGFARDGDLLQVPFIGAYRVQRTGNLGGPNVVEENPVTMDAVFAEDTDTNDDPTPNSPAVVADLDREQLGRFSPLARDQIASVEGADAVLFDDLYVPPTGYQDEAMLGYVGVARGQSRLRYRWARDLFDYLTVASPQDDFLPDVTNSKRVALGLASREPVANAPGVANGATEKLYPRQGRININTAPVKVLDMLPFVPPGTDAAKFDYDATTGKLTVTNAADGVPDNVQLAQAIVNFRDGNAQLNVVPAGPFASVFDLYRLDAVRRVQEYAFNLASANPGNAAGDFTPFSGALSSNLIYAETAFDGVRFDFEERNLLLTRISNLVTTRSDTFTVYLLVQGWRNAGTADAAVEVERRRVLVIDRARLTPSGGGSVLYPVPIR